MELIFLEFVVAKIDDLVNWARRVSLWIIFISHTVEKKCHNCGQEYVVVCLWLQIYLYLQSLGNLANYLKATLLWHLWN